MKKFTTCLLLVFATSSLMAQTKVQDKFGKGISIIAKDSSFSMKFGIRFQQLYSSDWTVRDDDFGYVENHQSNFLLRRSRLKFDGFAFTPKLKYKMEFGLTNRDMGGGIDPEHNMAPRFILDAFLEWNFYKNFTLKFGQAKLPGNRERVISSANLQFVDRSRLNSRFNIDRDMGVQLKHNFTLGKNFIIQEIASFSQGEGRNMTVGNIGGYCYTFRAEFLPFGKFQSKGDYIGASIKREEKPKLSIGATYDINDKAPRERGQGGSFLKNLDGTYAGKTLNTVFVDMMFKFQGLSIMAEFADKRTADGDANVYDKDFPTIQIGDYYTGRAFSYQMGYMFQNNWEIAGRYTTINSETNTDETEYTLGVSKYFVGHKLKWQTDLSYRQLGTEGSTAPNNGSNDRLFWRMQVDIHF